MWDSNEFDPDTSFSLKLCFLHENAAYKPSSGHFNKWSQNVINELRWSDPGWRPGWRICPPGIRVSIDACQPKSWWCV